MTRDLDIVLWGATGFTGQLAVAYLKGDSSKIASYECKEAAAPADLRWAICGRNRSKLEALDAGVEMIVCDAADRAGIEAFVECRDDGLPLILVVQARGAVVVDETKPGGDRRLVSCAR